jgi:hypothetical protein
VRLQAESPESGSLTAHILTISNAALPMLDTEERVANTPSYYLSKRGGLLLYVGLLHVVACKNGGAPSSELLGQSTVRVESLGPASMSAK